MRYTIGSIIQFVSDHTSGLICTFTYKEKGKEPERWELPIIGWAIELQWNDWERDNNGTMENPNGDQHMTRLVAVVLENGNPTTVSQIARDCREEGGGHLFWEVKGPEQP